MDISVRNDIGALVRLVAAGVSYPSGCSSATWDGRNDDGAIAADGSYELRLSALNASGTPTTATAGVVIDSRLPGTLTLPADGSTISGTTTFEFTPTDGIEVTRVQFAFIDPLTFSTPCQFVIADGIRDDSDGSFRAALDSTTCPHGSDVAAFAVVAYLDGGGQQQSWYSPGNVVTIDNPPQDLPPEVTVSASPRTFAPGEVQLPATTQITYCASDSDPAGPLEVGVRVLDSNGTSVRTLVDETRLPTGASCPVVVWDGTDDNGQTVPDGQFVVEVVATDPTGKSDTATVEVSIDRRGPGTLTSPEPGSTITGLVTFEFTPTPEIEVTSVQFAFVDPVTFQAPCGFVLVGGTRGADGRFRGELDSATCPHGSTVAAFAFVEYADVFGQPQTWYSPGNEVTVDNPPVEAPPEVTVSASPRVIGPESGFTSQSIGVNYCAADSDPAGALAVMVRVIDAQGGLLRTLVDGSQAPTGTTCPSGPRSASWDGLDGEGRAVADGRYAIEVVATDHTGLSDEASIEVAIDRRLPGVLAAPSAGSSISGATRFEFEPAEGSEVTAVGFALFSCTWSLFSTTPGVEGADGVFRADLDSTTCPDQDEVTALAIVTYTGPFGEALSWFAEEIVVVDNPAPPEAQVSASPRVFAPKADGTGPTTAVQYCADDSDPNGELDVRVAVVDETGSPVRDLVDEITSPSTGCRSVAWNGLDDDGHAVVDGLYEVELRVTDPTGRSDLASQEIAIDRRGVGELITPVAGATLTGAALFEFQPVDGIEPVRVDLILTDAAFSFFHSFSIHNASPDGVWRTTVPVGQFPAGAAVVAWTVQYHDRFGELVASDLETIEAAIDPISLPLEVDVDPASGVAPLDTSFSITTSDPNSRPVQVSVSFGDGTTSGSQQLSAPYVPLDIDHRYEQAGTYRALVSVSNADGAYSSRVITVTVSGPPNSPPAVSVETTPTAGSAPLDVVTTIDASDEDGDDLTYRVDFGDGSAPATGALPVGAIEHRYAAPGTYLVRTEVNDGTVGIVRTARISVVLDEELVANAGDDQAVLVDDEVRFDAQGSRPSAVITSYEWDFGDGTSGTGPNPTHAYLDPGEYEVELTVRSGSVTDVDTAIVTVAPIPVESGLLTTVRTGSAAVAGADVVVVQADGSRISGVTSNDGTVRLHGIPDGEVTVYVYAPGLQPAVEQATLVDGGGELEVILVAGQIAATELSSRPLTIEEIVDLGIPIEDPENQHVYEYEVSLYFEPTNDPHAPPVIDINPVKIVIPGPGIDWVPLFDFGDGFGPCHLAFCEVGPDHQVSPQVHYVNDIPVVQWLIVPGRASWLKEFFEVQLVIQNLAPPGFTFQSGSSTLQLPEGLRLAPTSAPQSLSVDVADLHGGESTTTTWVVRGDVEGSYDLVAEYAAMLEPIGRSVTLNAATASPLKVWGASALETTIEVDDAAASRYPYELRVSVANVSDRAVYNLSIEALDEGRENYILQPRERTVQAVASLEPGGVHTASYLLVPTISGSLSLSDSFVVQTGGDVVVAPEIVSHEPSQTPATAPNFETFRYPTKVAFRWEAVPSAASYEIYRTPEPDTNFGPEPEDLTMVDVRTGWTPVAEGEDPYWALSPLVDDVPWMRHPLVQSSAAQEYPRVTGSRSCNSIHHNIEIAFEDPIFDLDSYEVQIDGESYETGELSGRSGSIELAPISKTEFDLEGSDLSIFVTNVVGDTSRAETMRLRSVCIRYAALGDSFSSGEGALDYAADSVALEWRGMLAHPGSPVLIPVSVAAADMNRCHRSVNAYGPRLLASRGETWDTRIPTSDAFLFAACSGAKTEHLRLEGQYPNATYSVGYKSQINHLSDFVGEAGVDLVTVSIGGNDFGFSGIIASCVGGLTSCASAAGQRRILEGVFSERDKIAETLTGVKQTAGSAPVYALGYPNLIDPMFGECGNTFGGLLSEGERQFAHDVLVPYMNLVVEQAAQQAGAVFVDVEDAMIDENGTSHVLCSPEPWVNGLDSRGPSLTAKIGPVGVGTWIGTGSFHPNARGQEAMFERVRSTVAGETTPSLDPVDVPDPATYLRRPAQFATVEAQTPGGSIFTDAGIVSGRSVTVGASGFEPGSTVSFVARSEPVSLGEVVADVNGDAELSIELPAEVGFGIHSVEVSGTAPGGQERLGGVTVVLLSDPPVAVDDDVAVEAGMSAVLELLGNDSDPNGDELRAEVVTGPEHGSLSFRDGGQLEYTSPAGSCETDSFTYVAWDGEQPSEPATVTVSCAEPRPVVLPGRGLVTEGDADEPGLVMSVHLSRASDVDVTVGWRTLPSSGSLPPATPGTDFESTTGTVTFAAGETEATITVPVLDDDELEGVEFVGVSFFDATNARIGGFYGIGFGTIRDDDTPVATSTVTEVSEGDEAGVARLEVRLSKPAVVRSTVGWETANPAEVDPPFASAGADFESVSGTAVFEQGETVAVIEVPLVDDVAVEEGELLLVRLVGATGARLAPGWGSIGWIGIHDDDGS